MTTAERIKSNREMEARIAARKPLLEAKAARRNDRKINSLLKEFVETLPPAMQVDLVNYLRFRRF